LAEGREYGEKLYAATKDIAPSLIRYTKATDYDKLTRETLRLAAQKYLHKNSSSKMQKKPPEAQLAYYSPAADIKVTAALLFASSDLTYTQCLRQAGKLSPKDKKNLFKKTFAHLQAHDAVFREMENADLLFELVLSSSCFAQLKRHRMSTIIAQEYNPQLGVTVPPSIKAIGEQTNFVSIMRATRDAYEQIGKKAPQAASYILTNAHRKRVLMKLNAREMYHLARLRADAHAQWDIRKLTQKMLAQAKKAMPLTLMMACGKDSFSVIYKKNFPRG
jgi:thymidylate synthase ThyX